MSIFLSSGRLSKDVHWLQPKGGPVEGSCGNGIEPYVSVIGTFSLHSRITVKRREESHY
jgi:hypothetical protein